MYIYIYCICIVYSIYNSILYIYITIVFPMDIPIESPRYPPVASAALSAGSAVSAAAGGARAVSSEGEGRGGSWHWLHGDTTWGYAGNTME